MRKDSPKHETAPSHEEGESAALRKPHEMIVMVPRSHRISLTARKIYNVLLQVAQDRLASMESMPARKTSPM